MGLISSTPAPILNLEPLPEDVVNELFRNLESLSDITRACRVCKLWRDSGYTSSVWMKLYVDTFRLDLNEYNFDSISSNISKTYVRNPKYFASFVEKSARSHLYHLRTDWHTKFVRSYTGKQRIFKSNAASVNFVAQPPSGNVMTKTRLWIAGEFIYCIGYSIGAHERLEIMRWRTADLGEHHAAFREGSTYIFGCSPTYFFSPNRFLLYIVKPKQIETFDLAQWTTVSEVDLSADVDWASLVQDGLAQISSSGSALVEQVRDGNEALKAYNPIVRSDKLPQNTDMILVDGELALLHTVNQRESIHLRNIVTGEDIRSVELRDPCLPTLAKFLSPQKCIIAGEFKLMEITFDSGKRPPVRDLISGIEAATRSPRWNFVVRNNMFFGLADHKNENSSVDRELHILDLDRRYTWGPGQTKKFRFPHRFDGILVDDDMNVYLFQDHSLSKVAFK